MFQYINVLCSREHHIMSSMGLYRVRREMSDKEIAKRGGQAGSDSLYSASGPNVKKKKKKKRKTSKPGMNREEMVMKLFSVRDKSC